MHVASRAVGEPMLLEHIHFARLHLVIPLVRRPPPRPAHECAWCRETVGRDQLDDRLLAGPGLLARCGRGKGDRDGKQQPIANRGGERSCDCVAVNEEQAISFASWRRTPRVDSRRFLSATRRHQGPQPFESPSARSGTASRPRSPSTRTTFADRIKSQRDTCRPRRERGYGWCRERE